MDHTAQKTPNWYCLLPVFIGFFLLVQAGSATLEMDTTVSPQNLWPGNSVTVTSHVYDGDNSGIPISNGFVHVVVIRIPGVQVHDASVPTNASGWATFTFTPSETGRYSITPDASANYNNLPGLPAIGVQHKYGPSQWINVSPWYVPVTPLITVVLATTTTAPPATTTTTLVPPDSTAPTTQPTTPVILVTQGTRVTQVTSSVLVPVAAATVHTVTSSARIQQIPERTTDSEETLIPAITPSVTAADIPSSPMPLWFIALIIFVLIAAIGGGLYLKSRLDAEQKK